MRSRSVLVTPGEKGKYKVMVDFIQRGVSYSSPQSANYQAQIIAKQENITNVKLVDI